MPAHANIVHVIGGSNVTSGPENESAWRVVDCGHCGRHVNAAVIALSADEQTQWLRCSACDLGLLVVNDAQYPAPKYGEDVEGLPQMVAEVYTEARNCFGVAAYTAAELMCRKLLMQAGVDKGADAGKSFVQYLDHLSTEGYITPPMRPWADLIRKRGNVGTHDLPAATREEAVETLAFTTQLLRLVYEMEYRAKAFLPPAG